MKATIAFCLVAIYVVAVSSTPVDQKNDAEWKLFKDQYKKTYEDYATEFLRKKIFLEHKMKIDNHNAMYKNGKATYEMAINEFSDLTHSEFVATMTGLKYNGSVNAAEKLSYQKYVNYWKNLNIEVLDYVDWRDEDIVTPVKNQKNCGSCWAFAATGTLEGQQALKSGNLKSLSEQNMLDCSYKYGNKACFGGFPYDALKYVKDNGGLDTDESYPYKGRSRIHCRYKAKDSGVYITDVAQVDPGDEEILTKLIAKVGPIAIHVDASQNFQNYNSGVFNDSKCSQKSDDANHAVLVVGYSTSIEEGDYWIVKNSWGRRWGEDGYIRIARGKNVCGIANVLSYPII